MLQKYLRNSKTNKKIFVISLLFLTGMSVGGDMTTFVSPVIQNFGSISDVFKMFYIFCFLVIISQIYCTIVGGYSYLAKGNFSELLLITTIIYSLSLSIDNYEIVFMPYSLNLNLTLKLFGHSIGIGINVLGVLFLIWWHKLKGKKTLMV